MPVCDFLLVFHCNYRPMPIFCRTQAFEWYHLQWPWMTPNIEFTLTPLFEVEYLRNGTRSRHNHNVILIMRHFKQPWVTLSDLAKYSMTRSIARPVCDSRTSCASVSVWHVRYVRVRTTTATTRSSSSLCWRTSRRKNCRRWSETRGHCIATHWTSVERLYTLKPVCWTSSRAACSAITRHTSTVNIASTPLQVSMSSRVSTARRIIFSLSVRPSVRLSRSCIVSVRLNRSSWFLPRDATHKCGLCRQAVSVRLFVCPSRSCILSKRLNISSNFCHHRVATPLQFFSTPNVMAIIWQRPHKARYTLATKLNSTRSTFKLLAHGAHWRFS